MELAKTIEIEFKGVGLESGKEEYYVNIQDNGEYECSEVVLPDENMKGTTIVDGVVVVDYEYETDFEVEISDGGYYKTLYIKIV